MGTQVIELYGGDVELRFAEGTHAYFVDKAPGVEDGFPVQVYGASSIAKILTSPDALIWWAVGQASNELLKIFDYEREQGLKQWEKPYMLLDEVRCAEIAKQVKFAHRGSSDNAMQLGTIVHEWVAKHLQGEKPNPLANEEGRGHCEQFLKWAESVNLKSKVNERMVLSLEHGYAGTLDMLAEVNGRLSLIDMKVSSGIYEGAYVQTAGYRMAYLEEMRYCGLDPGELDRWTLLLNKKTGRFKAQKMEDHERDEQAFLGALAIYKWINWRRDGKPKQGGHFRSLGRKRIFG